MLYDFCNLHTHLIALNRRPMFCRKGTGFFLHALHLDSHLFVFTSVFSELLIDKAASCNLVDIT